MRQSHRLVYNTIINWIAKFIELCMQFFLMPFIIARLGKEGYAIFVLVYSITILADWIRNGIGQSIVKYSSEYLSNNQYNKVNQILSTICPLAILLGLIFAFLINIPSGWISTWMNISTQFRIEFRWALIGISILVISNLYAMPYIGILHSLQRYDISSVLQISFRLLRAILIVCLFLFSGSSITTLVIITFLCDFLFQISLIVSSYRLLPTLKVSFFQFRWTILKSLAGFSILTVLIQISAFLTGDGVSWIMAKLFSPEFVTYIVIMNTPAAFSANIVQSATMTIMPVASKYQALNDMQILRQLFIRSTRYVFILCCCFGFLLIPVMSNFLKLWMGPEYVFLTPFMIVLGLSNLLQLSISPAHQILRGLGFQGKILIIRIISGLICLGIIIVWAKYFNSPFWGVTFGLSTAFIISAIYQLILCMIVIHTPVLEFLWQAYGQSLILFSSLTILLTLIIRFTMVENIFVLLALLTLSFLGFVVLYFKFFINGEEKLLIKDIYFGIKNKVRLVKS